MNEEEQKELEIALRQCPPIVIEYISMLIENGVRWEKIARDSVKLLRETQTEMERMTKMINPLLNAK